MVEAIDEELLGRRDFFMDSGESTVRTLYFGGGTPSVCSAAQIGRLIDRCGALWVLDPDAEITLEANPEDLTAVFLSELRAVGVNRLSIGIQSFDDTHLAAMNRSHSGAQAVESVIRAQSAGFDNITIDLMYGLPFMTARQWRRNLDQALELGVQHISAYHLGIEPQTVFGKRALQPVNEQVSYDNYHTLCGVLHDAGYEHYEISNFALPGYRSRHNSGYWSGCHYLGVGPSAHSYDGTSRSWNVSSNKLYLQGAGAQAEVLSSRDRFNELIMTGLRTSDGVCLDSIEEPLLREKLLCAAEPYIQRRQLHLSTDNRLTLSEECYLISDAVISDLFI